MVLIRLQDVDRIGNYTVRALDGSGRDFYVGVDWDFPSLAETFGSGLRHFRADNLQNCDERMSDGTIDCPCGYTVMQFIADAIEYLDNHIGDLAEDPGYYFE